MRIVFFGWNRVTIFVKEIIDMVLHFPSVISLPTTLYFFSYDLVTNHMLFFILNLSK